jgi:hypothetical protein
MWYSSDTSVVADGCRGNGNGNGDGDGNGNGGWGARLSARGSRPGNGSAPGRRRRPLARQPHLVNFAG